MHSISLLSSTSSLLLAFSIASIRSLFQVFLRVQSKKVLYISRHHLSIPALFAWVLPSFPLYPFRVQTSTEAASIRSQRQSYDLTGTLSACTLRKTIPTGTASLIPVLPYFLIKMRIAISLATLAAASGAFAFSGREVQRRNETVEMTTRTIIHTMDHCTTVSPSSTSCGPVAIAETVVDTVTSTLPGSNTPFFPIPNSTVGACQGSTCITASGTIGTSSGSVGSSTILTTVTSDTTVEPTNSPTSTSTPIDDNEEGTASGMKASAFGLVIAGLATFTLL